MFEKEAEEIVKRNVCGDCNKCQSYGYIGCDIYRYSKDSCLYGLRTGYNKANEWHKVADGDLPSEEGGWVCNQDGLPCYFDWGTEQWLDCEGTQIRTTEWCHMSHKE